MEAVLSGEWDMAQERGIDWDQVLMERELQSLERERVHLESKALERPLTQWEEGRLGEIDTELSKHSK